MVVRYGVVSPTIHDAEEVNHTTQYNSILGFLRAACARMGVALKLNSIDISSSMLPKESSATFCFACDEGTDSVLRFALRELSDCIEKQGVHYFMHYSGMYRGECELFVICELKNLVLGSDA